MSTANTDKLGQRALGHRAGASRQLLMRKARLQTQYEASREVIESSFPRPAEGQPLRARESFAATQPGRTALAQQRLQLGNILPNPNTVLATMRELVAVSGVK